MRTKFKMELPTDILQINKVFKSKGFELFVVGGAVRDAVLGIEPKDFDLATNAEPNVVESIMQMGGFKTLATGKAFGVINVFAGANEFEIATFRKDIGIGRRPDTVEFTTIEGDVQRRDLTCNALFFDIETEEIVDLVGGLEDIKNNMVRTVGPANDRFNEDRLRILRAIRFASRFGSDLDDDIIGTLMEDNSLEGISGERIHDEFIKGIKSAKSVKEFLSILNLFDLFDWIFPKMKINKNFIEDKDPLVVMAKLLANNNIKTLAKDLNNLKFTGREIDIIMFLIKFSKIELEDVVDLKREQIKCGVSKEQIIKITVNSWVGMHFTIRFLEFQLSITGDSVMEEFGIKAGPELGKKIKTLELENFLKL